MLGPLKAALWLSVLAIFTLQASTVDASAPLRRQGGIGPHGGMAGRRGQAGKVVPNAYFVMFKQKDQPSSAQTKDTNERTSTVDDTVHTAFEQYLKGKNVDYTPRLKFNKVDLISGMSVTVNHPDAHSVLSKFEGVDTVYPIHELSLAGHSSRPIPFGARDSSATGTKTNPVLVPKLTSNWAHEATGVDKVHAQGNYGDGVRIGVIDTGVDYTHHALNGGRPDGTACFGPGCPISGGMSFYDDQDNFSINSDPFPYACDYKASQYYPHGTHVTGIIVANDTERGVIGAAPRADLRHYRAANCNVTNFTEDILISAMQRAYFDGADVISLSVGGPGGFADRLLATVMTRISDHGVAFVAAVGNDGDESAFMPLDVTDAPASHGVGAVSNPDYPGFTAKIDGAGANLTQIIYLANNPVSLATPIPIIVQHGNVSLVTDGCSPYPDGTPNLEGYAVIIIPGGSCDLTTLLDNINAANATLVLFISDLNAETNPYADGPQNGPLQVAVITENDGYAIIDAANNTKVTVDFTNPQTASIPTENGNHMAWFSQYGPTFEMASTVASSAPGQHILSTLPLNAGGYARWHGTSMATPLVAASYALYKSAKGKQETPRELRSIFSTTAVPMTWNSTSDVLDSVARQGGGMMRVDRAIASTTRVFPDFHGLNDTDYFNGTQTLTITNVGAKTQQFSFEHLPAGTIFACDASQPRTTLLPSPLEPVAESQSTVSYSPASAAVAAGESVTVTATYTAPEADPKRCGIYSGYTHVKSDDPDGSLTVPYIGIAASMKGFDAIYYSDEDPILPLLMDPNTNASVQAGEAFDLTTEQQQPVFGWASNVVSRKLKIDLVNADVVAAPARRHLEHKRIHGHRQKHQHYARRASSGSNSTAAIPDSAIVASYGYDNVVILDPNTMAITRTWTDDQNATHTIPDGDYRLVLRVLKLYGNVSDDADYEQWVSPQFSVKA